MTDGCADGCVNGFANDCVNGFTNGFANGCVNGSDRSNGCDYTSMKLIQMNVDFTVCKISDITNIDFTRDIVFVSKTPDEISLVCETDYTPPGVIVAEPGWTALKLSGILDFGLIGIIARIAKILADAGISIFVVSTYNTDYVLLKNAQLTRGIQALTAHGYVITGH